MGLLNKLQEASVFQPPTEKDVKKRLGGAKIHYEMADDGGVDAYVPGFSEPLLVNVKCVYTSKRVYESDSGSEEVKSIEIQSFEISEIFDEYDEYHDEIEALASAEARIRADKDKIQMMFQDHLMEGRELR